MKWQYQIKKYPTKGFLGGKFDENLIQQDLNEQGRQEWELVAAFDTSMSQGMTKDIVLLFKKPY